MSLMKLEWDAWSHREPNERAAWSHREPYEVIRGSIYSNRGLQEITWG
jgi:hypothetical protein